jgi:protein SCO1/2
VPEVCPITLATLAQALASSARARDVQVVYVTVDPERDDAARMKKYLHASIRLSSAAPAGPRARRVARTTASAREERPRQQLYGRALFVHLLIDRAGSCAR